MADINHTVPILGFGQKTKKQCWLASFQMIFSHAGRSTDSVKDILNGTKTINVQDCLDNGMPDTVYAQACSALGLQGFAGTKFNQDPAWYDVGLSDGAEAFIEELRKRPLWVSKCSGSSYHAIVVVGYRESDDKLIWNNPYVDPYTGNAFQDVPVYANTFVKNISNAGASVMGKKM